MFRLIRLAVIGLIGYWLYDTISASQQKSRLASAAASGSSSRPVRRRPANITGNSGRGATTSFHDADGAERRQTVGRGVIS